MARIGRRGRLWLRSFHIFFMVLWIGAVVSQVEVWLKVVVHYRPLMRHLKYLTFSPAQVA